MPNSALAEVYFIAAMMILILVICGVSVYLFFKTFYKEKKIKETMNKRKAEQKEELANQQSKVKN